MELKSTMVGKHLSQHPYNRVRLLNAGIEVSGEKHHYMIPFNQLLAIDCKRGLVWGELEFTLPGEKVVRLHGTEWTETQRFFHYLERKWNTWSEEMSRISAEELTRAMMQIQQTEQEDRWLCRSDVDSLCKQLEDIFAALPLPHQRIVQFDNCASQWLFCQQWYQKGELQRQSRNKQWASKTRAEYTDFFSQMESSPLDESQVNAVINGERAILTLAGAGSGKSAVLIARAAWMILRNIAAPEQILLIAFDTRAAQDMDKRISHSLNTNGIKVATFDSLALHIIKQGSQRMPSISTLETDTVRRHQLLINSWRQQCIEKKSYAKGWRTWLEKELKWKLAEGSFWLDDTLSFYLVSRLERWLGLIRAHDGTQTDLVKRVPADLQSRFSQHLRLMAPIIKVWKKVLKEEQSVDFPGLFHQAIHVLNKGRFITPWKAILVDEFQDISPQCVKFLMLLRQQNNETTLFTVGDDWQAICNFANAEKMTLPAVFRQYFAESDHCILETTYRLNDRINDITSRFIQENPHQIKKPLNSLQKGDGKSIVLLPEEKLAALLDKLSSFVTANERILVLARYHHLRPKELDKAHIRWPKLNIDFMTIDGSRGQQADYVILVGLRAGEGGFPAIVRESMIDEILLPPSEEFPDGAERRLAYVAMTRARQQVWLLYDHNNPSAFVGIFRRLGVKVLHKP